jgi:lycopene beta-cyclase
LKPPLSHNYTIVGAGASGLWLAHALLENGLLNENTLCVIEVDKNKTNDRTWCYWATAPIAPVEMISKNWSSIQQSNISPHSKSLSPYQYYHVRSADFYSIIKAKLKACKNISWIEGEMTEFHEMPEHVELKTHTESITCQRLFLSALPHSSSIDADYHLLQQRFLKRKVSKRKELFLWQSFVGWRVKTSEKIFSESSMSMMDFSIAQNNQTQFMYELPFSASEALVEMTRFGKQKLTIAEAEIELKKYMEAKGDYEIIEVEQGAIPMTPQFDMHRKYLPAPTRVIYMGTMGGAIKPTTGFGFKRMHHYAESLALALKENKILPSLHRPFRFRLYDVLLLKILEKSPNRGKEIFEDLFRSQPINRILRFLDERTNLIEEIMIFSRLPIRLFLKSLFHHFFVR